MRFSPLAWCAVVFVMLGAVACDDIFDDDNDDGLKLAPIAVLNDNDENSSFVPLLTTELQGFVGETEQRATLTLSNQGTGPLLISAVRLVAEPTLCPTPSPAFRLGTTSTILQAQSALNIEVAFDGNVADEGCALLEVLTSDVARPVLRAHLIARPFLQPRLCITGGPVEYPQLFVGQSARRQIVLEACAPFPSTTIESMTPDASFPSPFLIIDPPTLPLTLTAGEQLVVEVDFIPVTLQLHHADLTFIADGGFPTAVHFSGFGRLSPDCQPVLEPDVVRFPTTQTGGFPSTPITVRNIGATSCVFDGSTSSHPGFSLNEAMIPPGTEIPAQGARQVYVLFRPGAAVEAASGGIDFTFNGNITRTLALEGESEARGTCALLPIDGVYAPADVSPGVGFERVIQLTKEGQAGCRVAVGTPRIVGDDDGTFAVLSSPGAPLGDAVAAGAPFQTGILITDAATSTSIDILRRPAVDDGVSEAVIEIPWFTVGAEDDARVLRIPLRSRASAPCFTVNTTAIEFGAVTGQQSSYVEVVNCGRPFHVTRTGFVGVSDPRFSMSSPEPGSFVTTGASFGFTVFVDTSIASTTPSIFGTIELAIEAEIITLPVRANVNGVCETDIVCRPLDGVIADFGRVAVGELRQVAVLCENRERATSSGAIDVVDDGPFAGGDTIAIAPGTSRSVRLQFAPATVGAFSTDLIVSDDGCGGTPVAVRVEGEGFAREPDICAEPGAVQLQNVVNARLGNVWATPIIAPLAGTSPDIVIIEFGQIPGATNLQTLQAPVVGTLRAVSSTSGGSLWTGVDTVLAATTPAVADLDGDGSPEVIAVGVQANVGIDFSLVDGRHTRGQLLVYDARGRLLFRSAHWSIPRAGAEDAGAIAVGDVDGDGRTEIAFGDQVFNSDGTLRWRGDGRFIGSAGRGPRSFFADVVGDSGLELVAGPRLYDGDTGAVVREGSGEDGLAVVADLDGDDVDELVVRGSTLRVFAIGASALVPRGTPLSPPTRAEMGATCAPLDDAACHPRLLAPVAIAPIDDVAGDDVIVTSGGLTLVYGFVGDALVEIQRITLNDSAGAVPPTAIDLDGDDRYELLVGDGLGYRLLDGTITRANIALTSTSLLGGLVVGDVDGDGRTDIVRANARPFEFAAPVSLDIATSPALPRVATQMNQLIPTTRFSPTGASVIGPTGVDDTVPARAVAGICER